MDRKQGNNSSKTSLSTFLSVLTLDKAEDALSTTSKNEYSLCFSLFDERKGSLPIYHSPSLSQKEVERIMFRTMVIIGLFQNPEPKPHVNRKKELILPLEDVNRTVFFYLFELTPKSPQKFRAGKILGAFAILTPLKNQHLLYRDASIFSQALDALFESIRPLLQNCCSEPNFTKVDFSSISAILANYSLGLE